MESLKIAFFCWESLHGERVGGLANAATHLAETLARTHEVHFFTRGEADKEMNGVQYHFYQPWGGNIIDYCRNMGVGMVERFHQYDQPKFDILHFHDWHTVEALHLLQDRNTVLTYHSTEYGRNGNRFGDWWEYREISGKEWYGGLIAKRVTTVSQTLKDEVMRLYNVPDWKCDVIPNGVIPQAYRAPIDPGAVKQSYGIHPYAPLIMFIGRLAYQKGPDLLVDAVVAVHHHRWDAQVVIAGDGGMRNHLENKARGLPVKFLGYIPDSAYLRLLNAADIVAIPSRNEPFGLVLLEAWSAGKCVVATNVGGLSENIDHSVNGIKVDVTPDSLAWGITNILDDPARVRSLGEKGQRKVERHFQWIPIANSLVESYKRVEN